MIALSFIIHGAPYEERVATIHAHPLTRRGPRPAQPMPRNMLYPSHSRRSYHNPECQNESSLKRLVANWAHFCFSKRIWRLGREWMMAGKVYRSSLVWHFLLKSGLTATDNDDNRARRKTSTQNKYSKRKYSKRTTTMQMTHREW